MGDHLVVAVGLINSEDHADLTFRDPKGKNLLRVPHYLALRRTQL